MIYNETKYNLVLLYMEIKTAVYFLPFESLIIRYTFPIIFESFIKKKLRVGVISKLSVLLSVFCCPSLFSKEPTR